MHHCDSGVPEASMLVRLVELYPYVQSALLLGLPSPFLPRSPPLSSLPLIALVGFLLGQLLRVKGVSWVREALANHGDPMVAALVLHSGNDVAGGNRGYPTLTIYDYWNCTGAPALWCSWLPELLAALFEGGGSLLPAGWIICAISG